MELESDFRLFLSEIRPTRRQLEDLRTGHKTLRERLLKDEDICAIRVSDFLQGSYRRATAVRPKGDRRADVDIVIVTKLSEEEYTPAAALALFEPFLDRHYKGKWRRQGRSFGIELSYVDLDLVPTSAPSEAQIDILKSEAVTTDDNLEEVRDWRLNGAWLSRSSRMGPNVQDLLEKARATSEWAIYPLRIPDRAANMWEDTHPIEQIRWTRDKNRATNGHFVNVVKAIKWWRLENYDEPKHPKGFPLERLIGECCPDGISSVAQGITLTLENIVRKYAFLGSDEKPFLPDYGVPAHDVFARVTEGEFHQFYEQAELGAKLARRALDSFDRTESGNLWRELLGFRFPNPPDTGDSRKGGYTLPKSPATPGGGRFA